MDDDNGTEDPERTLEEDSDVEDLDEWEEEGEEEFDLPVRRRLIPVAVLVVLVAVAGAGIGFLLSSSGASNTPTASGPEGVALQNVRDLAPAGTTASGAAVDGITCRTSKDQNLKEHFHQHLDVYVNGQQYRIPAGVGIPAPQFMEHLANGLFIDNSPSGGCLYWLHVHSNDGVIHVESPQKETFTLGQLFDIWQQPLGRGQVGPMKGSVTAFEDGKRFIGNPRDIPLSDHAVIQLDVGAPVVAFQPVQFKVNGLCGAGKNGCAATVG